jgi:hypothetical protein
LIESQNSLVVPGLVPRIHKFSLSIEDVDGRDKPGHDEGEKVGPLGYGTSL